MHFIEYDFLKVIKIKIFLRNVLNLNRCLVVINNISIINNMLYIHISTKKIINNMQDIEIEQEQKIEINATKILSKYKSINNRKLFCFGGIGGILTKRVMMQRPVSSMWKSIPSSTVRQKSNCCSAARKRLRKSSAGNVKSPSMISFPAWQRTISHS